MTGQVYAMTFKFQTPSILCVEKEEYLTEVLCNMHMQILLFPKITVQCYAYTINIHTQTVTNKDLT